MLSRKFHTKLPARAKPITSKNSFQPNSKLAHFASSSLKTKTLGTKNLSTVQFKNFPHGHNSPRLSNLQKTNNTFRVTVSKPLTQIGKSIGNLSLPKTPFNQTRSLLTLPPLPYEKNALEPVISSETLDYHYDKHHKGYVTKFNSKAPKVSSASNYEKITDPMEVIQKGKDAPLFNFAAQVENHTFYWKCMASPESKPFKSDSKIGQAISKSFGSFENFQKKFEEEGANHFGSGWIWLVRQKNSNDLSVIGTHDAEHPFIFDQVPVLTCDVWEHAFYIDYRNDKPKYLTNFWRVANWEFAEKNLM